MNSIHNTPEVEEIKKRIMTEDDSPELSSLISILFDFYLQGREDEKNQKEIPVSFVEYLKEKKLPVIRTYLEIQTEVVKEIKNEFLNS